MYKEVGRGRGGRVVVRLHPSATVKWQSGGGIRERSEGGETCGWKPASGAVDFRHSRSSSFWLPLSPPPLPFRFVPGIEGLGKIVYTNLRTPRVLLDFSAAAAAAPVAPGAGGGDAAAAAAAPPRPLNQEPLLAARIMVGGRRGRVFLGKKVYRQVCGSGASWSHHPPPLLPLPIMVAPSCPHPDGTLISPPLPHVGGGLP